MLCRSARGLHMRMASSLFAGKPIAETRPCSISLCIAGNPRRPPVRTAIFMFLVNLSFYYSRILMRSFSERSYGIGLSHCELVFICLFETSVSIIPRSSSRTNALNFLPEFLPVCAHGSGIHFLYHLQPAHAVIFVLSYSGNI